MEVRQSIRHVPGAISLAGLNEKMTQASGASDYISVSLRGTQVGGRFEPAMFGAASQPSGSKLPRQGGSRSGLGSGTGQNDLLHRRDIL